MSDRRTGQTNSLVDVAGLRVGHVQRVDEGWLTGSTVVLTGAAGAVGGVDVRGGGPGTRETDLLDPRNNVQRVAKSVPWLAISSAHQPAPMPSSTRPFEQWSMLATCFARMIGSRCTMRQTAVPSRIWLVTAAAAAIATSGSMPCL